MFTFTNYTVRSLATASVFATATCVQAMELVRNNLQLDAQSPHVLTSPQSSTVGNEVNAPDVGMMAMASSTSASVQKLSPGIKELAQALGTADAVYKWVQGNIDYSPYYGSKKGAEQTFLTRSGNDSDQADLLIAMFRELGYTAYFREGLIDVDFDKACNWVGAPDEDAAFTAFLNAGYTYPSSINYSSTEEFFRLQHIFVVAYDEDWYHYYPAVKGYAQTQSADVESMTGYSRQSLLTASGGSNTADCSEGQDYGSLGNYLTSLSSNFTASLKTDYPNSGTDALFGSRKIDPDYGMSFGLYSYEADAHTSLPYEFVQYLDITAGSIVTYARLPSVGAGKLYFTYTNNLFTLYLDDAVVDSGIDATIDSVKLSMDFPEYDTNREFGKTNNYPIASNGLYVISFGYEDSDRGTGLDYRRSRFSQAIHDATVSGEEKLAETLALTGETFMRENAALQRLLGNMEGLHINTRNRIGLIGQDRGYYVDIKNNLLYKYNASSDASTNAVFFSAGLMMLSGFEHAVLEQEQGAEKPAVSTVKIFSLANGGSNAIYRLDADNYAVASTNLNGYSQSMMNYFSSVAADGGILVVPQDASTTLIDWNGSGFFEYYNIVGGRQSMTATISGGYNGGYGGEEGEIDFWKLYAKEVANAMEEAQNNNPEFGEPVDMVTGAYLLYHDDLTMDGPIPLRLSRHYSSQSRNNKGSLGNGWVHSFEMSASRHSAYDAGLGLRTSEDAASVVVATTAIKDLLLNEDTARGWLAATLTANWAMEQLVDNAVSVNIGQKVITFVEQPDGSFTPPPGMTVSLTEINNAYTMQERHGNTYVFNTNGLIDTISDPYNNTLSFSYTGDTNLTVISSFGPEFSLEYNTSGLVYRVEDNSIPKRVVEYQYDDFNNLTNFVDTAGKNWGIAYDGDHQIKSLVDPEGITTIQNFYNDAGQVTNQISPSSNPWNYYFTGTRNVGEDPLGNQTAYYIDGQQRTWSVEKADGTRTYTFQDGQNHVTSTFNEAGTTNIFVYDVDHNLLAQTNAVGTSVEVVSHYGYDSEHHLRFVTNAMGTTERLITEYAYTDEHAVDYMKTAKGSADEVTTDYTYNGDGLLTTLSEGNGKRITTYSNFDSYGNALTVNSTLAGEVNLTFDIQGNLKTSIIDGKTTTFSYNDLRQPTGVLYDDGSSISKTYYDNGLLKTSTDANNETTSFYWTPAYKQAGVVLPNTGSITNLYDDGDRLVMSRDAEGNWSTNTLDEVGRVLAVSSATSSITNQYDAVGNLTTNLVDPNGLQLENSFVYDSLNRMTHSYRPIGHDEFEMDAMGRVTNQVNAASKDWKTEFDKLGRTKKTFRPSGANEEYGYDKLGNRTQFLNAEGKPIYFGIDAQGRVTSVTNAINKVTSFDYDDAGNLEQRTSADQTVTDYGYDSLNRLVAITNEGVEVAVFDHDDNGNITLIENDEVSIDLGYNEMNQLTASTQSVHSVTSVVGYQYDLNGNRTHITYPGGTNVVYVYGADNRLDSVNLSAFGISGSVEFNYDGANRLTNIVYPNGVNSTFGHDDNSNITSIKHGSFIDRTIQRNLLGFKETELIDAGLKPTAPETARRIKTHNDADQLVSEQVQSGTNWTGVTYSYSDNGCLTNNSETGQSLGYDYDSRIVRADDIQYLYDASGVRVGRVDGAVTNYFVVDYTDGLKRPLAETDVSGTITRFYVWSGSQLLCHIEADGEVYYYHSNELGSTLALTDTDGDVTDQFAYMPYGYANHSGSNSTPFQWLGGYGVYYDADTDLHLTLHRAYSCMMKRFLHPDPLGIDGGANVYAMANLNPLFFVDPLGLYNQAVDYWADMYVNSDNVFVKAGAAVMGTLAGDVPDVITIDGRGAAALLSSVEGGAGVIINLNDGSISGYDTRGLGVGTKQASGSLTVGLGWNSQISSPDNSDFGGVFHEYGASWTRSPVGETASIYHGGGWFGVNYGISAPAGASAKYSVVDYDIWDGSDRRGETRPWYDILTLPSSKSEGPAK
ncbi:DUF6531 domain-containing protein [Pontiellaceae bacterium B12227]|nr:DUF6531 domain-containing protein [Pontiellaceae bacterium B12227]